MSAFSVRFIVLSLAVGCTNAWQYISSSNVVQGTCIYADFESTFSFPIKIRENSPKNAPEITKRVVNGKPANINDWPWIVALLSPNGPVLSQGRSWDINCGGTLIHPEYVLTAAHCVIHTENETYSYRRNPQDILARIGDNNLYDNDVPNVQDILIDKTYTHPNYDPLKVDLGYDIALLHLSRRFERRNLDPIRVACLPQSDQKMEPGSKCYVAGWGAVSTDGNTSPIPLYTVLQTTTWQKCQTSYGFNSPSSADGKIFCAGPIGNQRTDTCTGDSGGAIFCKNPIGTGFNSLWQLTGLVSFGGEECAPRDLTPGVYTTVSYFRQWILETMSGALVAANPAPSGPSAPRDPYTGWLPWYMSRFGSYWRSADKKSKNLSKHHEKILLV